MPRTEQTMIAHTTVIDRQLPANSTALDVELFKDRLQYLTRGSTLIHLSKCRVSPDSVVYDGLSLVEYSLAAPDQAPYYRKRHLAKKILTAKGVTLAKNRRYLLVTDPWSPGHYHWLTEVLPKLYAMGERTQEYVLLLPRSGYIERIGIESLRLLNLIFQDIVWMEPDAFYKVPDLYYVTRIADRGELDDQVMQALNRKLLSDTVPGERRLYISRVRANFRKVLNESEFTHLLSSYGFETIHSEALSLTDQIEIFSRSNTIIGLHGAGLTNSLFMPPGGSVVELRKREKNYAYWHLADALGHKYFYYHGTPDSEMSLIGRGCNLTIDLKEFEDRLLRPLIEGKFDQ